MEKYIITLTKSQFETIKELIESEVGRYKIHATYKSMNGYDKMVSKPGHYEYFCIPKGYYDNIIEIDKILQELPF